MLGGVAPDRAAGRSAPSWSRTRGHASASSTEADARALRRLRRVARTGPAPTRSRGSGSILVERARGRPLERRSACRSRLLLDDRSGALRVTVDVTQPCVRQIALRRSPLDSGAARGRSLDLAPLRSRGRRRRADHSVAWRTESPGGEARFRPAPIRTHRTSNPNMGTSQLPDRLRRPRHGRRPRHRQHARLRARARHRALRAVASSPSTRAAARSTRSASRRSGCSAAPRARSRRSARSRTA